MQRNTPRTPPQFIARSDAMRALVRMVERLARTSVAVLIEGESGVGKELVARALHDWSPRAGRRFIVGNCAAIPESLAEAELFGHIVGAFTGALRERRGMFEAADGGTFFLDELGEMPPGVQAKLLRVLEDGEYRRLGDNDVRRTNVRVVAATNRDMEAEVRAGRFREDLFFRLSAVRVRVPPLRERPEEILDLADHFLERAAVGCGWGAPRLDDDALACLMTYPWPGNVRELRNEMERVVALHDEGPFAGRVALSEKVRGLWAPAGPLRAGTGIRERVADVERSLICEVLDRYDWNKTRVARELGMTRQGLAKKMSRFGIPLSPKGERLGRDGGTSEPLVACREGPASL